MWLWSNTCSYYIGTFLFYIFFLSFLFFFSILFWLSLQFTILYGLLLKSALIFLFKTYFYIFFIIFPLVFIFAIVNYNYWNWKWWFWKYSQIGFRFIFLRYHRRTAQRDIIQIIFQKITISFKLFHFMFIIIRISFSFG